MKRSFSRIFPAVILLSAATLLLAQLAAVTPFYSSAATGYEAIISPAFSGSAVSVQTTVSPDLKYVTVGGQFSKLGQPTFTPFTIAIPTASGFVGLTSAGAAPAASASASPATVSILDRPGITLVAPLQP